MFLKFKIKMIFNSSIFSESFFFSSFLSLSCYNISEFRVVFRIYNLHTTYFQAVLYLENKIVVFSFGKLIV
jgi:hypothetical protein